LSLLASRGAIVIDADALAREAVIPGSAALEKIVATFGDQMLTPQGELDRGALAAVVFSDEKKKNILNEIVHPEVRHLYHGALEDAQSQPHRILVYDIPLLTEARSADEFDLVVVVDAPAALRHQRLIEHRGLEGEEATKRIQAQVSDDHRLALADIVLDSSGSEAETRERANRLYDTLEACWPDRLAEAPAIYRAATS
jgi:dephospho-CoA kinase